jgi:tRNA threonylcarbamoyladenosine biosynthesis protein TsaE
VSGRDRGTNGSGIGARTAAARGTGAVTAWTATAEDTAALAAALAALARPGDVILLVGGLGAGKTTFARGFARALGVEGPVTSPTFTLVREYECGGPVRRLLHADLYRLDTLGELADLGLGEPDELAADGAVALVEWGDVGAEVLGDGALTVAIEPAGDGEGDGDGDGGRDGDRDGDRGDSLDDDLDGEATGAARIVTLTTVPGSHAEGVGSWASRWRDLEAALAPFAVPGGVPDGARGGNVT